VHIRSARRWGRRPACLAGAIWLYAALVATSAAAQGSTERQALDDAWWTGPIFAASAATLPEGHVAIEPYLYDVRPYAHLDGRGDSRRAAREDDFGSLTYLYYGLADGMTVGLIPHFGYRRVTGGQGSRGVGVGDLTIQAQYRLTQFHEGGWTPTTSLSIGESLPVGRHDRLDDRPADGFGTGAYTTTVTFYGETYGWPSGGRILRSRVNLWYSRSSSAGVKGESVYGTPRGFAGRARPGDAAFGDISFEYSLKRNWVAAIEFGVEQDGRTRVTGRAPGVEGSTAPLRLRSSVSRSVFVAPAVEYSLNANLGVLIGAEWIPAGRNVSASVTPVLAINWYH